MQKSVNAAGWRPLLVAGSARGAEPWHRGTWVQAARVPLGLHRLYRLCGRCPTPASFRSLGTYYAGGAHVTGLS